MKQLFLAVFLLVGIGSNHAQIQKTIHQMYPISASCKVVNLDIENPKLVVHYTSGSRIMIETYVKLKHSNLSIINFMVKNGRYNLSFESHKNGQETVIKGKKQLPEIKLKGKVLEEEISYVIYLPHSVKQIYQGEESLLATKN